MKRLPERYYWALFGLGFCAVLGAVTLLNNWQAESDLAADTEQSGLIEAATVVHIQTYYRDCRHSEEQIIEGNSAFVGMDAEALAALGYELIWQAGEAYLSVAKEGYCTVDAQKRHLRIRNEKVGVFDGPLEGGGELLYYLDISLQLLPARWLAQLTAHGMEFPDEETLMMALDNLDELTGYLGEHNYV